MYRVPVLQWRQFEDPIRLPGEFQERVLKDRWEQERRLQDFNEAGKLSFPVRSHEEQEGECTSGT